MEFIAARQSGVESRFLSIPRRQESFKDVVLPTFLEGVRINTSAADAQAITQLKLHRWNGKVWEEFGELMNGAGLE